MGRPPLPLIVIALLVTLLTGCVMPPASDPTMAPAAEEEAKRVSALPDPVDGSFNAVLVHGGEVAAGGWDHAHNDGPPLP